MTLVARHFTSNHVPVHASPALLSLVPATISVRTRTYSLIDQGLPYLAQRAVNHPTMDGTNRVRMEIPSEFDLSQLLSLLSERQGRFNIRASQAWGSLYVLDLGETYKFLKNLSDYNGNSKSTFIEFIDRRIVDSKDKSKNWLSCLADCDPMNQAYVSPHCHNLSDAH